MKRTLSMLCVILVAMLVTACGGGGGGGGSSSPAAAGFSQTYTTSATAGELMTYSIDTSALTYSFTITKSSYGCEVSNAPCHSGSGTLTKNSDGTYTPSGSPSSKIHALQNGLLVGSVTMAFNGVSQTVPIVGVSNPITTAADLAGTFNFMSLQCAAKSYGLFTGCATYQGSATLGANGTFTTCSGDNISANVHTCTNTVSGTMTSLGGGIWQFQGTSPTLGATTNYLLAFSAPNGQKVAILDFNDATVFGYGQAILSTQVTTAASDLAGNYLWANDYGSSGVVTLNSNDTTSSGLTIAENSPWSGLATVTGGGNGTGYGMIAGNGVYVYRNPNIVGRAAYLELGLKIQ